ncbi:hypothetical protein BDW75DRAFT_237845 [Aspergillus navahoensis]
MAYIYSGFRPWLDLQCSVSCHVITIIIPSNHTTEHQELRLHRQLNFDEKLQPKSYNIAGTYPDSRVLITDVRILDATGREPYHGDVLITGTASLTSFRTMTRKLDVVRGAITHVGTVPNKEDLLKDSRVRVFYGNGRTLVPGLGDAHAHLSWNGGDLAG